MPKRHFPSEQDAHERAQAKQLIPSIEPTKKKVSFKVKVTGVDLFDDPPKSMMHTYQLKTKKN